MERLGSISQNNGDYSPEGKYWFIQFSLISVSQCINGEELASRWFRPWPWAKALGCSPSRPGESTLLKFDSWYR
jgi:hypothetical protein